MSEKDNTSRREELGKSDDNRLRKADGLHGKSQEVREVGVKTEGDSKKVGNLGNLKKKNPENTQEEKKDVRTGHGPTTGEGEREKLFGGGGG